MTRKSQSCARQRNRGMYGPDCPALLKATKLFSESKVAAIIEQAIADLKRAEAEETAQSA